MIRRLCLMFIFMSAHVLFSQGAWKVTPMLFDLAVSGGDTLSRTFIVSNETPLPMRYRVMIKDFMIAPDGSDMEMEPGSFSRGCAGWIRATPLSFSLAPGKSQEVRFTMGVPKTILPGSHWAGLYVEPEEKPKLASRSEGQGRSFSIYIQMRARVSVVVTLPGLLTRKGEITEVKVEKNSVDQGLAMVTTFVNKGNMILKCKGNVEIRNAAGQTVDSFDMTGFTSLPENEIQSRTKRNAALRPGEYSALVVVDFGGDYLVAGEAFFDVP